MFGRRGFMGVFGSGDLARRGWHVPIKRVAGRADPAIGKSDCWFLDLLLPFMMSLEAFEQWFVANGGFVDKEYVGLTEFPEEEGGRGMVALKDIPVREPHKQQYRGN